MRAEWLSLLTLLTLLASINCTLEDQCLHGMDKCLAEHQQECQQNLSWAATFCVKCDDCKFMEDLIPALIKHQPTYIHTVDSVAAQRSENIELTCTAFGRPKPLIQWERNGVQLMNNYKYHLSEKEGHRFIATHTLLIRSLGLRDYGTYTCRARNMFFYEGVEHDILLYQPGHFPTTTTTTTTTWNTTPSTTTVSKLIETTTETEQNQEQIMERVRTVAVQIFF